MVPVGPPGPAGPLELPALLGLTKNPPPAQLISVNVEKARAVSASARLILKEKYFGLHLMPHRAIAMAKEANRNFPGRSVRRAAAAG